MNDGGRYLITQSGRFGTLFSPSTQQVKSGLARGQNLPAEHRNLSMMNLDETRDAREPHCGSRVENQISTPQRDSVVENVELNRRSSAGGDVAIEQEVEEDQDEGTIFQHFQGNLEKMI